MITFKNLATAFATMLLTGASAMAQYGSGDPLVDAFNESEQFIEDAMRRNAAEMQRNVDVVRQMIQNRMNDPRVQQAYRQHQANGSPYGRMSYDQFTYYYMATAGFTPDGIALWNRVSRQINLNDAAAVRRYLDEQQRRGQNLYESRNRSHDATYERRAEALTERAWYGTPDGSKVHLPYTATPGTSFEDDAGNVYTMTPYKYYQMTDTWGRVWRINPINAE